MNRVHAVFMLVVLLTCNCPWFWIFNCCGYRSSCSHDYVRCKIVEKRRDERNVWDVKHDSDEIGRWDWVRKEIYIDGKHTADDVLIQHRCDLFGLYFTVKLCVDDAQWCVGSEADLHSLSR